MTHPRPFLREERIFVVDDLEARADGGEDKPLRIVGHPVVYNRWSEDLGGFRERIAPGAATKTLREADIRVLFNHNADYLLGRNTAGTATFTESSRGVRMEAFPPDTPTIRDLVITPMQRGDLTQMSFAFRVVNPEPFDPDPTVRYGDHWEPPKEAGGLWERTVNEIAMYDASVVTFPAYTQTDAAVRSTAGLVEGVADLDLAALSGLLTRAERGLPLSDADTALLLRAIAALRSHLPPEPVAPDDHSTTALAELTAHQRARLAAAETELRLQRARKEVQAA